MRHTEIIVLRLFQEEFPLCPRPFLELACRANRGFCRPRTVYLEVLGPGPKRRAVVARHKVRPISEREVIAAAVSLVRRGQVRRIAGIFAARSDAAPGSTSWRIMKELEGGLPLVPEPYRELSRRVGVREEELIERIRALRQEGRLRRLGAVFGPPASTRPAGKGGGG